MLRKAAYAAAVISFLATPAFAAGDAAKGAQVFKKCMACHAVDKEQNKVGPHLVGIVGRKAGAVANFKYSKSVMDAGAGGLTWTEDNIAKYLKDPKDFIKGNKMAFAGLTKESEVEDVIAYLKSGGK